ncbi:MAG: hypothetical protein KGJ86_00690, partial [Chloroflexota bacterium]|nr:hypothetical protein [Chloroflexota bacterium]
SIPFIHEGWSADDFHDIDSRSAGDLLIAAFCEEPYLDLGTRVPLLDEVSKKVGLEVLQRIPDNGFSPKRLHAALDGTPFSAVADYIDWMWGMTNTTFLDFDNEMEVTDADWEMEIVQELKERWHKAEALMARIKALSGRLEQESLPLFTQILERIEATPEPEGPNYPQGDDDDGDTA